MPDTRAWYVNERGERDLSFSCWRPTASIERRGAQDRRRDAPGPGFRNVAADAALDRPEMRVVPKFDVAARLGVAPSQIAETIRVATIGDIDANLAKFNAGDRQVPIRVQLDEDARTDMQREQLRVTNADRQAIPLAAVADVTFGRGPSSISRYDRERRAVIGVDLETALCRRARARNSSRSSRSRTCRPASACSRPATPRCRTRWRPAS